MIIMPDANLDQVVDALIGAGYGSAGERCMAISVAVPVGEQTAERLRASSSTASPRCGWATASTRRPTTDRSSPARPGTCTFLHRQGRPAPIWWSTAANVAVTNTIRRPRPVRRLLHRPHPVRSRHQDMVIYTDGSSARCSRSSGPPTTRKPRIWHRITSTATVSRSSPRTATRPATSPPVLRWAWWCQRAHPGSRGVLHLRRLEALGLR